MQPSFRRTLELLGRENAASGSLVQRSVNRLGKYRLVAELARGGMGVVWLAEMRGPSGFAKKCVVKELLPELATSAVHRTMFCDEATLAARFSHRNIVQTNDFGCEDGRWFMALELLEGCTLRRLQTLLGERRLRPALAARIVCEVLAALDYAHELRDADGRQLGIVHRDVTPQNVFVGFDGQVKLLDFGVAKSRTRREETKAGMAKGSIAYMSPDHVSATPIDRRADVFSAGMLLRELLTGRRLWRDLDDRAIVARLLAGAIPAFDDPTMPGALRRVCEVAMAADRGERFATAAHMRNVLEGWLEIEDPQGSLDELAELLAGELPAKPELAAVPTTVVLPSSALVTATPSVRTRLARLPKREIFVTAMALVASVAAAVSVAFAADRDDPPTNVATEVVRATPGG